MKRMSVDTLNENDVADRNKYRYNYDDECLFSSITHLLEISFNVTFPNEYVALIINLQNGHHKGYPQNYFIQHLEGQA